MENLFVNIIKFKNSNNLFKQITFNKNFKIPINIEDMIRQIGFDNLKGSFGNEFNCFDVSNYYLNLFKKLDNNNYNKFNLYLKGNMRGNGKYLPVNFKYSTHYISGLKKRNNFILFDFSISYLSDKIKFNVYFADNIEDVSKLLNIVYTNNNNNLEIKIKQI